MTATILQRATFDHTEKQFGSIVQTGQMTGGQIELDGILFRSQLPNSELGAAAINATMDAVQRAIHNAP